MDKGKKEFLEALISDQNIVTFANGGFATTEALYQAFAERFRQENEVMTGMNHSLSNYYKIVPKDT